MRVQHWTYAESLQYAASLQHFATHDGCEPISRFGCLFNLGLGDQERGHH